MTGVEDEDIITASFVNAVHIVPFYVVKAERGGQKQVIIAIRGTLSIKVGSEQSCKVKVCASQSGIKSAYILYSHCVDEKGVVA